MLPAVRSAFTALAMAGAISAVPVCAQLVPSAPTGSRIQQDPEVADIEFTRRIQKTFARCVYNRNPDLVERFLENSDPVSVDFEALGVPARDFVKRFSMEDCLQRANKGNSPWFADTALQFPTRVLRPLLAEEAYLLSYSQPADMPEGAEEIIASRNFYAGLNDGDSAQAQAIAAFADCIVFHAPAESDALLRTALNSGDERRATQALVPTISDCVFEGQEVELTVASIRMVVAEGLWSRSYYNASANVAVAAEQVTGQ